MSRYAVVVDGYHFPDREHGYERAFRERGIAPLTVLSTEQPLDSFRAKWCPDDWEAVYNFDGDLPRLLTALERYEPICIVSASEHGVELAAALAERLTPTKSNVRGSAIYHRDKGQMALALQRAGLPALRTICTDDADETSRWILEQRLSGKRLVVKPPKSSGAEDVHVVEPGDDWRSFFKDIVGSLNCFGNVNQRVVVQEYAEGTEYIVDLYSVDGKHGLVTVCVYNKIRRGDRIGIYDTTDFVEPTDPNVSELVEYAKLAADAVGIRNGSTHAEIMLTSEGPRLIELAARQTGTCMPIASLLATRDNQIQRTVRHHVDEEFVASYDLVAQVRVVKLVCQRTGVARDVEILEAAADLPTVTSMLLPKEGDNVEATVDGSTRLGWIIQCASDRASIVTDYNVIKALELRWNSRQMR